MMTLDDALRWIERLFECPTGSLHFETVKEEIVAWDSLGVLTLIAGLNEDFGIEMTDSELRSLKSIKDIITLLQNKGKLEAN
jgi:acyl carrier protein